MSDFPELYYERLMNALPNMKRAKEAVFDYFVAGIKLGMPGPQLVAILVDDKCGIFKMARMGSKEALELIDYIKYLDISEIYKAADVPFERDFQENERTGKWEARSL